MEGLDTKINMVFYILKEGDIKELIQKWNLIPNKLYTIGRSKKEATLVIDEKLLSRNHAELIYYNKDKIFIKDLNSRNGTYINKERIEPLKDIYFTIKDTVSFGNTNNELVFYEEKEKNKRKDIELDKDERIIRNYEKIDKKSYPKDYEYNNNKYYNETEYYPNKNRYSKHYSNKSHSKSKSRNERSRSRETYKEESRHYSKKDNNYILSSRGRNEKEYVGDEREREREKFEYENRNRSKYDNERIYNENEKYRDYEGRTRSIPFVSNENYQRRERMEEKERNSNYRRSLRSKGYGNEEEFTGDKVFLNVDKIERMEKDKNLEDSGFIKCYVSGYMMLNIKK